MLILETTIRQENNSFIDRCDKPLFKYFNEANMMSIQTDKRLIKHSLFIVFLLLEFIALLDNYSSEVCQKE